MKVTYKFNIICTIFVDSIESTKIDIMDNNVTSTLIGHKLEYLTFGWTDYMLFVSLLGVSIIIGVYFGFFKKQDNTTEYLLGGKTMSFFPISMSLIAR